MVKYHTACLTILLGSVAAAAAAAETAGKVAADKQALAPLQALVGQWKGVGQPKRASNQGAWTEEGEWAWSFPTGRAELVARLDRDKYYSQWRVQPGEKPGELVLLATPVGAPQGEPQMFNGSRGDGGWVFLAQSDSADLPARISLRLAAGGDRLVVLYEKRAGQDFLRMAEVGSTRHGSSFAKASLGGPECVVTGGLGKIAVEYQGKKYYVCCGGCRDLFLDDPQGVLADYRQRKAAEKNESKP